MSALSPGIARAGGAGLAVPPRPARYAMYGLHVLSEVPLPVPALPDADMTPNDWVIRRRDASCAPPLPDRPPIAEDRASDGTVFDRFFRHDDDAWLWDRQAGTCHLQPRAGRITVYAAPGADEADLGLLLLGPVSSFMLHQVGFPNLHASAVVTPWGACAFLGPSTLGKSTLAARLLRAGARLLTDDILPLHWAEDGVYGRPGAPMMKLWPATARHALGIADDLPRLTGSTDKRLLDLHQHERAFENRATYLRAIYVPDRYDPKRQGRTDVAIETLGPRDAVLTLLSQTFRGHYLHPHELGSLLERYVGLARQVRVARLRLPHGLEYLDDVTQRILADLAAA